MESNDKTNPTEQTTIKRTVLDFNDISSMVPALASHEKLVNKVLHWLSVDKVNAVHDKYCDHPGPEFANNLLKDFDISLKVDEQQVLALCRKERLSPSATIRSELSTAFR